LVLKEVIDHHSLVFFAELKLFFDRYLKDIRNGWELTPRVRMEVQDALDCLYQENRPETSFPIKRTEYKKLYLYAAKNALSFEPVEAESSFSYDGNTGVANFDIKFEEDTEITGDIINCASGSKQMVMTIWICS